MDLVNIIYRYVNRFLNSEQLIEALENIDLKKFSEEEVNEIIKLKKDIKEIIKNIPCEIDEIEIQREKNINKFLKLFDKIKNNPKNDEKTKKFIDKKYDEFLKDKKEIRDCGPRYNKIFELLNNNSVYIKYCKNMNDLELLNFITQYISVPVPPLINQEVFNALVLAGIKEDKKEAIWRLAMTYHHRGKDFSKIIDYFIKVRDDYYLAELISGVHEDLDLDSIIDKVLKTNDLKFIKKVASTEYIEPIFTNEQKEKVKKFI